MNFGVLFCISVILMSQRVQSFVDECDSTDPGGLKIATSNLTVDTSRVGPHTDPNRYSRNTADDGFVKYASSRGFESLLLTGYVYSSEDNTTTWKLSIRTGLELDLETRRVLRIGNKTIDRYKEPWPESYTEETGYDRFSVNFTFEDCPKVVEIWMRGYASVNISPGWALQIGRVELQESLFEDCRKPRCFRQDELSCSTSNLTQSLETVVTTDDVDDFSHVYLASENLVTESAHAIAYFNGDFSRIRRTSSRKGILTYAINEGIRSIEVTLYHCSNGNSSLTVTPYFHPQCKPLQLDPELIDDSYHSRCWRRYKASVDFADFMDCLPRYVDLVISGTSNRALQISQIVLTGYGPTIQDGEFSRRLNNEESSISITTESEDSSGSSDDSSDRRKYWIPALVIGVVVVVSIIIAALLIVRNETAKEYIKDYINEKHPKLYDYIYTPGNTTAATQPCARSKTRTSPSGRTRSDTRVFGSQSLTMGSLTFDKSLKKMREPASRGTTITRDGFGEQLIDLSKHLHRSFWSSKVGGKGQNIDIEERLGKGGFGKVWKARWQGTLVAVKVVPLYGSLTGEEKATRMAIMEAALTGCLAHPNIVSTYTCEIRESNDFDIEMQNTEAPGDTEKRWMALERFAQTNASKSFLKSKSKTNLEVRMIMEYCDRGSLVEAIRNGWFKNLENPEERDFEAILQTALDIARGLGCLHQNNIIHGDLKPHNVLLQNKPFVDTRGFIAKIADFGLSIQMEQEQSHVDGMRMGTGGYVSPEVALRGKILPASDIYSFGILLWEMFTGELIQDALKDAPKVSSRLTMGSWRPIFKDDCPRPYWRLASMCWNDFPDWRPTLDYIIDELNDMLKTLHCPKPPSQAESDAEDSSPE